MSFLSKLEIDGFTFNIEDCTVAIEQNSDYSGRPNSKPLGGKFTITMDYSKNANLFAEWAVSANMTKSGKIIFYNSDAMSVMQTIAFKNAYCLNYVQNYNSKSNKAMSAQVMISARDIAIGDAEHSNNWPEKS